MITTNRLFLVPAISSILILVPIIGIGLWLLIVFVWYIQNQGDVYLYLKGQNYRQNEASNKVIDEFK